LCGVRHGLPRLGRQRLEEYWVSPMEKYKRLMMGFVMGFVMD